MDNVTPEIRSRIMARIKQRDTKIEVRLRKALWRAGIRYRKNVRMFGTPDLFLSKPRVLVFVDSCFWHGCRFHCRKPKSNTTFWETKITRNRKRDKRVTRHYRRRGYVVLRFWEHEILADLDNCVTKIMFSSSRALKARLNSPIEASN